MATKDGFPTTLVEAIRYFSDPDVCREFVAALRWPDGVSCAREDCGSPNVHFIETRKLWRCNTCKKQFSIKVGTIFEDSPIGLDKWLPAVWMLTCAKQGVSSYQMARALGVTQKTAWFLDHRIRLAMKAQSFAMPLEGEVEVDESFLGGKERFKHENRRKRPGGGAKGKAVVMGLLERHGELRAATVPTNRKDVLQRQVRNHVAPGSAVYTDALRSYSGLSPDYLHGFVDHTERYVDGRIHTNGLENFWSLLKRGVSGTYHAIEPIHLDRYLDEFTSRFNTRKMTDSERFMVAIRSTVGRRVTYKELIGETS